MLTELVKTTTTSGEMIGIAHTPYRSYIATYTTTSTYSFILDFHFDTDIHIKSHTTFDDALTIIDY